ncbi:hypothetical protein SO802_021179 [Lithocarpus litseifolius]|uniref:Aminotransferase-like plant mobile domain-containing protein n=1 Tax=Lithocarpus litseifolius TaxID=425828 RepID=A0AAW2CFM2_9ROSI
MLNNCFCLCFYTCGLGLAYATYIHAYATLSLCTQSSSPYASRGSTNKVVEWYNLLTLKTRAYIQEAGFKPIIGVLLERSAITTVVKCLIERWWDTTHTFHVAEQEMTMTPYNFYRTITLIFEGAIINLDGTDLILREFPRVRAHLARLTSNKEKPNANELIGPPHLPWTVYAYGFDGFARERAMPHNPNVIGYHFPPNTRVSLTLLTLNCNPLSKSMRSWYGWLNLKLGVTNYSRNLYGPRGVAYLGGGDDGDDDNNGEEDSEVTPSYHPRKRRHN